MGGHCSFNLLGLFGWHSFVHAYVCDLVATGNIIIL